MRRGELCPLADCCTVTQGVEEIQHFVTSAGDKVSHRAEVPTARIDADPGSPPRAQGVSQASQPTAATRNAGWGNGWHNLAGCCASVNIIFMFLNVAASVRVGGMKMTHTEWSCGYECSPKLYVGIIARSQPQSVRATGLGAVWRSLAVEVGAQPWLVFPFSQSLTLLLSLWYSWEQVGFSFWAVEKRFMIGVANLHLVWLWKPQLPSPSSWTEDGEHQVHRAVSGNLVGKML